MNPQLIMDFTLLQFVGSGKLMGILFDSKLSLKIILPKSVQRFLSPVDFLSF